MIIDTHQHTFWHGRDDAGLIADMDEQGIDVAWLLTWEIPVWETSFGWSRGLNPVHARTNAQHAGIPLCDVITARDRYPERFLLGYCPDPLPGNAADLFDAAYRIHGVRVCGEWKFRLPFDDPRCLELYRQAGELKCPIVFHLDAPFLPHPETAERTYQAGWYGGTIDNLERALQACPDSNFIGHAPGFWRYISGDQAADPRGYPQGPVTPGGRLHALFDQYPNLYADLSAGSAGKALSRDPEHARQFLERYADRLLFARDYYGSELDGFLRTLDLPPEIHDKIYFGNAQKLVHAGPGAPQPALRLFTEAPDPAADV